MSLFQLLPTFLDPRLGQGYYPTLPSAVPVKQYHATPIHSQSGLCSDLFPGLCLPVRIRCPSLMTLPGFHLTPGCRTELYQIENMHTWFNHLVLCSVFPACIYYLLSLVLVEEASPHEANPGYHAIHSGHSILESRLVQVISISISRWMRWGEAEQSRARPRAGGIILSTCVGSVEV